MFGIFQHRAAIERRKRLSDWASVRGYSFSPDKVRGLDDIYSAFDCLKQGNNRYAYNIIEGNAGGRQLNAFDYHYQVTTHTGKSTQTHHYYFSALIIDSPIVLKALFIRPETFMDKIGEFVGLDDIDFESAEFSKKFYVKSSDKKWAYDVIHQGMMAFLLAAPRFSIQFDLTRVMIWRSECFEVEDFQAAMEVVNGIFERIPEYVVEQQGKTKPILSR